MLATWLDYEAIWPVDANDSSARLRLVLAGVAMLDMGGQARDRASHPLLRKGWGTPAFSVEFK
jgi:hypothetical protein